MSIGRRTRRGGDARDVGAAAVEMALVLPLLLLLVFGIIDFGRALNTQITLTQGAREGARAAMFADLDDTAVQDRVLNATEAMGVPDDIDIERCSDSSAQAVVVVAKTFTFVTPFGAIAGIFGGGSGGSISMSGRGVLACG